jgi:hypothetical protein
MHLKMCSNIPLLISNSYLEEIEIFIISIIIPTNL